MKKPRHVLVGLKSLEQAAPLTGLACRLAGRGTALVLIHVIELPDITPLDAALPELEAVARNILRAGERVARSSRIPVSSFVLRAHSAGASLLDEMVGRKIDLAILGSHHGHKLGELFFGTTHQFLIRHAPCQILLSVPPRPLAAAKAA